MAGLCYLIFRNSLNCSAGLAHLRAASATPERSPQYIKYYSCFALVYLFLFMQYLRADWYQFDSFVQYYLQRIHVCMAYVYLYSLVSFIAGLVRNCYALGTILSI